MAFISRPGKEGNATTYQGKVAAGYTTILAQEVDADFDAIYSAWNAGVDTVNIKDGSITGAKLAPGAVGSRELTDGGVATIDLADLAVTTPKLADGAVATGKLADGAVTDAKVSSVTWNKITGGVLQVGMPMSPRGVFSAQSDGIQLEVNTPTSPQYDNTKASWLIKGNITDDAFELWRAPTPGTTWTLLFMVDWTGRTKCNLADLSVVRGQLAVNAIYGAASLKQCPAGYAATSPVGSWFTYMTLDPITTRGGNVALVAQHNLSCTAPTGGTTIAQRWVRGATPLQERAFQMSMAFPAYVPLPGVEQFDTAPAGTYTYSMQLFLGSGCAVASPPGSTQGFLQALEIG